MAKFSALCAMSCMHVNQLTIRQKKGLGSALRGVCLMLLMGCASFVAAQGANLDSLRGLIRNAPDVDSRLTAISDVVKYTIYNQQDTALRYAEKFLEYAELQQIEEEVARGYNFLGLVAYVKGDHVLAMENYLKSLERYEDLGELQMQGVIQNNIAGLYLNRGDIENTILYYQKAYTTFEQLDDVEWMTNVNYNLANQYFNQDKYALADSLYRACLEQYKASGNNQYQAYAYHGIASVELANQNYEEVLRLLKMAEGHTDCAVDQGFCSGLYGAFCRCYLEQGRLDLSGPYCTQAYEMASQSGVLERQRDATNNVRDYYKAVGNADSALVYTEKLAVLRDSLWNQEKDQVIIDMMARYESEKKEKQLAVQEMQLGQAERRNLVFGLIAALAAISLLAAIVLIRQKNKNNRVLEEKNAIINHQLAENEVLLKEIHHRVKNNLQVISSLLSLQSREISDPAALEAVKASRNRVKSMALIHQNLYKQDNLRSVNAQSYMKMLCESIFTSYNIEKERVKLELDVDDVNLDVDTTIPLGLIFNELISNSLKYAFQEQEKGRISICLKRKENTLHICAKDNGKGIDPLIAKQKEGSFGMKLIDAFAKKLKADWEIVNENGTQFTLDIANYKFDHI